MHERERADEHQVYNYEVGILPLIEKALGVQTFREDREDLTEFVTISYWATFEDMSRFTGTDPGAIHHLPRDPEYPDSSPRAGSGSDAAHQLTDGDRKPAVGTRLTAGGQIGLLPLHRKIHIGHNAA